LNNDDDFVKLMSDEEEERLLKNSYIQEGFDKGIEKLTKNMLKENIDIFQISKITGLSIDEITKIEKENAKN
ncbi:MAG: hypothetical protein ACI4WU_00035, partial [Bacilli bacterium]